MGEAEKLVGSLRQEVALFKIGLTFFISEGLEGIRRIHQLVGDRLFLDLKLHDIPETVAEATSALAQSGITFRFLTVHASDGQDIIRAAVRRVNRHTGVLGVTVLTHMTDKSLSEIGASEGISRRVLFLARGTKRAGGAGVVCSSQEAKAVKAAEGDEFIVVTPGIRPRWAHVAHDDQRRVTTPKEAIVNGADYLVIGRPIARAPDPVEAARRTAAEIEEAFQEMDHPSG